MEALGAVYIIVALLTLVIAVLWILMPFAIFGTKGILSNILSEIQENNRLLRELRDKGQASPPRFTEAP